MNIYFMDYRYIKPENWKYIVSVLKVTKVFCFCESNVLPRKFFSNTSISFMHLKPGVSKGDFSENIVYALFNVIGKKVGYKGRPIAEENISLYNDSKSDKPLHNLLNTEDHNALILGEIYQHYNKHSTFEDYDSDYLEKRFEQGYITYDCVGLNIIKHFLNLLRKKLGTDVFRQRICFVLIDLINGKDYLKSQKRELGENKSRLVWSRIFFRDSGKNGLIRISILDQLYKKYPDVFPLIEKDGKKQYTPFWDTEQINEIRKKWRKYCEEREKEEEEEAEKEREWQRMQQDARDWAEEVRQMNRDFWNECGEAGSNCESWPGWG